MTIGNSFGSSSIQNLSSYNSKKVDQQEALSKKIEETRKEKQEQQEKMASGKKVNSAADNAATMAIAQEILASYNGLEMTNYNISSSMSMNSVADSSLTNVQDELTRMRDLTVQASNDTLTDSDRQIIQTEIDQIKEGLTSTFENAEFNTVTLFDGNVADLNLETLGLADFDVTSGNYSIKDIDKAINTISSVEAQLGAEYNGMEYEYSVNEYTAYNLKYAQSGMEDTDYAQAAMDDAIKTALMKYQIQTQGVLLSSSNMNLMV